MQLFLQALLIFSGTSVEEEVARFLAPESLKRRSRRRSRSPDVGQMTGGEPTISPEFEKLLDLQRNTISRNLRRRHGGHPSLQTAGACG